MSKKLNVINFMLFLLVLSLVTACAGAATPAPQAPAEEPAAEEPAAEEPAAEEPAAEEETRPKAMKTSRLG